jgi:hypothetical protein
LAAKFCLNDSNVPLGLFKQFKWDYDAMGQVDPDLFVIVVAD